MPEEMFDGFDHTVHEEEVTARWGADAYARGDAWWRGMGDDDRRRWREESDALVQAWRDAASRAVDPGSPEAVALAERHIAWLRSVPGTPTAGGGDATGYVLGLADMYVADERFAATYGGADGARFVRAALHRHLGA